MGRVVAALLDYRLSATNRVLDGLAEQGLHTFIALFAGMHPVCRQSFQVVATVIGQRGAVVNERVVLLIRENS